MSGLRESVILVASDEFTLKSSPVRRTLEQRLIDDLRFALHRDGFTGFRIQKDAARLVVTGLPQADAGAKSCSRIFGVAYAAPGVLISANMEAVLESVVNLAKQELEWGGSFAIRAHVSVASPLSRREIELKGGSSVLQALLDRGISVNLGNPDLTIHVDLVGERAYVYGKRLQGPGGLPLSSQWKMLAILDSGPLTLLATFAMMRRGCLIELFIPLSDTIASFASKDQLELARSLRQFVTRPNYKAFTINYEKLLANRTERDGYRPTVARDLVRVAAAKFAKENKFKGLVIADAYGDISSVQRLRSASPDLPIFTPLIGLNLDDLIELGERVGVSRSQLSESLEPERGALPILMDLPHSLATLQVEELAL